MQEELIDIEHIPYAAPRKGTPGEGIYLKLWLEFNETDPMGLEGLLYGRFREPFSQRAASVAASFMVFMGCNGGRAFTMMAKEMAAKKAFASTEDAYLAAWAIYNKRVHGVNVGLRVAEYMLARVHPLDRGRLIEASVPQITQADMDVLEAMVVWWSTERAAQMRTTAERMIDRANQNLRQV
jgi:hypothetical protein